MILDTSHHVHSLAAPAMINMVNPSSITTHNTSNTMAVEHRHQHQDTQPLTKAVDTTIGQVQHKGQDQDLDIALKVQATVLLNSSMVAQEPTCHTPLPYEVLLLRDPEVLLLGP